jgi:hypothetical protein
MTEKIEQEKLHNIIARHPMITPTNKNKNKT